jgi:hypothetical protein
VVHVVTAVLQNVKLIERTIVYCGSENSKCYRHRGVETQNEELITMSVCTCLCDVCTGRGVQPKWSETAS